MSNDQVLTAEQALNKLIEGNKRYAEKGVFDGDVSADARADGCKNGQRPYAVVIACSDSRVIPESIFGAGLGELFVIRVAGNVIDSHQLGSVEYAAEHLGCRLIVVLGHTHCGAVDAAIHHDPEGYIKYITDEIKQAIGDEHDPVKASVLNVKRSAALIESSLEIKQLEKYNDLHVVGALYDIESGSVQFGI